MTHCSGVNFYWSSWACFELALACPTGDNRDVCWRRYARTQQHPSVAANAPLRFSDSARAPHGTLTSCPRASAHVYIAPVSTRRPCPCSRNCHPQREGGRSLRPRAARPRFGFPFGILCSVLQRTRAGICHSAAAQPAAIHVANSSSSIIKSARLIPKRQLSRSPTRASPLTSKPRL